MTTLAGSCPVPGWLYGGSPRTAPPDAVLAVLKTQELAGTEDAATQSAGVITGRMEAAATAPGAERIHHIHTDCGFRMLHHSKAGRKMKALPAGRNLFEGRPDSQ